MAFHFLLNKRMTTNQSQFLFSGQGQRSSFKGGTTQGGTNPAMVAGGDRDVDIESTGLGGDDAREEPGASLALPFPVAGCSATAKKNDVEARLITDEEKQWGCKSWGCVGWAMGCGRHDHLCAELKFWIRCGAFLEGKTPQS